MLYYYGNSGSDFAVIKSRMNSNNELIFEKSDTHSIDFREKSIVILCGNNSRSQRKGEFYAHLCHNWLKGSGQEHKVTTYSIYYPNYQPLFNENSNIQLNYQSLAEDLFGKIVKNNKGPHAVFKIKQSLSNVVFFGHSAGGYVMNKLMNSFGQMLKNNNFSKHEIREIYESIVFVAYAPYMLVDAPIKSVYVAPVYDTMGSTQRVYKYMLKSKNIVSSDPKLDIWGDNKINARKTECFVEKFKEKMQNRNALYFLDRNSLISTPNLLYSLGEKEDHNFAGVVEYPKTNPYQTKAGRQTTKFLNNVFKYCLTADRDHFSLYNLYQLTLEKSKQTPIL